MTNAPEDPDEVVHYDGFGAPIYCHALEDDNSDADHPRVVPDAELRTWGTTSTREISMRLEDVSLEAISLMTGYDFRLPLCEQKIPCEGQE